MASNANRRARSIRLETGDFTYEYRLSMLMLLKQREQRKKSLLHRLVLVSKIHPDLADKRELGGYYATLLQKLQRHHQGDMITGLLMLYPNYVIHVLESSNDVLYSVIQDLSDMKKQQERPLLLESKVLVMSHNVPSRLFQQWEYKIVSVLAKQLDDSLQREPVEKITSESLTLLLKLGMWIQKVYKESSNNPTDSLLDDAPELIIPQNLIARLVESRDLLTPAQFLHNYRAPLKRAMDSELVWPIPEHLLPAKRK